MKKYSNKITQISDFRGYLIDKSNKEKNVDVIVLSPFELIKQ